MAKKHETPQVLKDKLKEEVAIIQKLKTDLQIADQRLQDIVGAYILGAGLPQQGIRFDENFDLIYDVKEDETGEVEGAEPEDDAPQTQEMEVLKSPRKKVR